MSTIVVQNCAAFSNRNNYFLRKKILALREKTSVNSQKALKLLRTIVAHIVLFPHREAFRSVIAYTVETILHSMPSAQYYNWWRRVDVTLIYNPAFNLR